MTDHRLPLAAAQFLYHVKANDGRTDTAIVARSVDDVRKKMAVNTWWAENNLKPSKITKIGVVRN